MKSRGRDLPTVVLVVFVTFLFGAAQYEDVHGATVHEIPRTIDVCYNHYNQTLLPNALGDKSVNDAKLRMFKFFPLVYTLCSPQLLQFLCSVYLPRFNREINTRQLPCRSSCDRIYKACSYAINRLKFHWPAEMTCDKFQNGASCYDLFRPVRRPPLREGGYRPQRSADQCQTITPNLICKNVLDASSERATEYFSTSLLFSNSQRNYFNHTSKDEALYELSRFLPLLSSLWWERSSKVFRDCANDLTLLLCHLYVPVCPMRTQSVTQDQCRRIMNATSNCHTAITRLQEQKADFQWPPVRVNCFDSKWFSNSTRQSSYLFEAPRISPPPMNIRVSSRSSQEIHIAFQGTRSPYGLRLATAVLYRWKDSGEPYKLQRINERQNSARLRSLAPGKDYEINAAAYNRTSGFPGVFITVTNNTFGRCQAETTGEDLIQGVFFWNTTDAKNLRLVRCPYGSLVSSSSGFGDYEELPYDVQYTPGARRFCRCNDEVCQDPYWSEPTTYDCNYKTFSDSSVTEELSYLFQLLVTGERMPVNVSEELVNITKNVTGFQPDDVTYTMLILESIVQMVIYLDESGPNIVKVVNNILNIQPSILVESQRDSETSTRILLVLERYLEYIPIELGKNVTQSEENLAVQSQEISAKDFKGVGAASLLDSESEGTQSKFLLYDEATARPLVSQVSLTLPPSLFENLKVDREAQNQRISFVIYRQTSLFQSLDRNTSDLNNQTVRKKNSFVIAGTVKGFEMTNLTDPVVSTYDPLEEGIEETTACVFWDFKLNDGVGDWSDDGCTYKGTKNGMVTCHCNHLTNFAILMDVYVGDRNDEAHNKALSIISYIGCALSLVGLILTIITILIFKDLRNKAPSQILLNFCIALSITLAVFLAAAERSKTSSLASCRAAAIALHYFVLVVFMWMAIEAFNMYLLFVKVLPKYISHFFLKCCLAGWGLPAFIVIITAAVAIDNYGDEHFCRLQGLPFQVAFLAPVMLILVGNSVAFVFIIRSLLTSGSKVTADRKAGGLRQARRSAAIFVVLGLTWLFGVLAVNDAKLAFQYLFCIFNSTQGFLVFIFYCVLSVETRAKYKVLFCRKEKDSDYGHRRHHGLSSDTRFHEVHSSQSPRSYNDTASSGTSISPTKHVTGVELNSLKTDQ